MKKLMSLLLVLVMCLSLAACGGEDNKQPAIDAFNAAADAFDTLANAVNEDPDAYPQDMFDVLTGMSEALTQGKELLEDDSIEMTDEQIEEFVGNLADIETWCKDVYNDLENMTIEATTVDTSKEAVIETFNYVSTRFDAVSAEINANIEAYDEEFVDGMISIAEGLIGYREVLESGVELTEEEALGILEDLALVDDWITSFEG